MSDKFIFVLFIVLTILCIAVPWVIVADANKPHQVAIGPYDTFSYWYLGNTLTLDGTYTLKCSRFFELRQGETIKQSVLENAPDGKGKGDYWVRDYEMKGEWMVDRCSPNIFSLETTNVTLTPQTSEKAWHILMGAVWGLGSWILSLFALSRIP
jgi:hypothetical protein